MEGDSGSGGSLTVLLPVNWASGVSFTFLKYLRFSMTGLLDSLRFGDGSGIRKGEGERERERGAQVSPLFL